MLGATLSFSTSGEASKRLASLVARLNRRAGAVKTWGLGVRTLAREHALSHSQGGKFWRNIARHIVLTGISDSGATVLCDDGSPSPAAHKEFGGDIVAKNKAALTIPIAPEAQGRRASYFKNLFKPKGKDYLAIMKGSGKNATLLPLFLLRKKVHQKPQPWWVSNSEAMEIGVREVGAWLKIELEEGAAQ